VSQCFESVKRLKLLEPDVLCEALRHFPDDLTNGGVVLPDDPADGEPPYDAIQRMLMAGRVSDGLSDLLYYVGRLGNAEGWEHVVQEARLQGLHVEERCSSHSYAGCVMRAWLTDWPQNCDLLEKSFARTRLYSLTPTIISRWTGTCAEDISRPTGRRSGDSKGNWSRFSTGGGSENG